MSAEEWRPIAGFPRYFVSNLGRVRSTARNRECIRKFTPNHKGYLMVTIYRSGKPVTFSVHRLVAEAFIGTRPPGHECRHLNGDKTDNRLVNLRWGTGSENTLDAVRHGTHPQARKTHCPQGHEFTSENIYRPPRGQYRSCRTCRQIESARRWQIARMTAEAS